MLTTIATTLAAAVLRVAVIPLILAFVLISTGSMDTIITNTATAMEAFQNVQTTIASATQQ